MTGADDLSGRLILVCAPYGRDAQSLADVLEREGHRTLPFPTLALLAGSLGTETGAVLVAEEALDADNQALEAALTRQPPWSDIPFIVLAQPAARNRGVPARLRLPPFITNAIVIERPLGVASLVSAIASATRSRQRQFEMRDRLDDLRAAHTQLSGFNAALEEKVAQRTAELQGALARLKEETAERERAELQLRQSQKMEAIGQLTGGIAHDFNNMLTGVIGALAMMKRRIKDGRLGDLDRFMDAATNSAQRAASLTQRLLAFARRQSLDSRPIDVNALIGSLADLLHRTIGERIALLMALDADIPLAVADENQLESAILNLAINARDAMPEGGKLTLETSLAEIDAAFAATRPGMSPGRYVVIAISDTGVGMPPEILEKVFDPFFTTKPIGQGTGLGLSMVYGFAKQSNGQVRIHSRPGEGTSVTLYLPTAEMDAPSAAADEDLGVAAVSGHGETVLVVEDDTAVRMLVREVLEELGYVAVEASEARAAVPILASGRAINLMISDVGLPDMNGRQLAEVARTHRPDLPILFVTGYAENAAIRSGFLGTNMAMISKPFTVETLAGKISDMLAPVTVD